MFSIPSLYDMGTCSDSYDIVGMLSSPTNSDNPNLSPRSMAEAKAVAASISHKEAERRRRKRINGHIATLKSMLPNTIKTDKASLLGEAVRRVKELKKSAAELEEGPSEADELKVWQCEKTGLMKAALSCDDRPEIIVDMIEALKAAEAKVVRAEMSTVGGRTKSVLWVTQNDAGLGPLRRALKMVMDKSTLEASSGQGLPATKRPRYYHL
ncbi:transcription factor bHLH30-like [Salvia miltiorrhiza]|uniref:Basic helix-loop-helix transcription factor n=1 Tax=Salvia miltiorrhiza TaxID=226208 RepID=A0A0H3YBT0_SALMI|nr:transcription factor bHLH30-like [Salvia miltiorrhiza]AKN09591.1 basic helix-loop-helix transcription factor [Salvia miltiorrhiza]